MKKKDLLKLFYEKGWELTEHGARHDILSKNKQKEYIPRHREINEMLAKSLIKKHGLKEGK